MPMCLIPLSASYNDLLATLFTKKARRSVAHLTITNAKKLVLCNEV
ncbi:MAG: hypothetical protein LBQ66_01390 [Planctomycetaceae bacterium]|nr:hypothetical protein [Planctomycetaceae bacterium]